MFAQWRERLGIGGRPRSGLPDWLATAMLVQNSGLDDPLIALPQKSRRLAPRIVFGSAKPLAPARDWTLENYSTIQAEPIRWVFRNLLAPGQSYMNSCPSTRQGLAATRPEVMLSVSSLSSHAPDGKFSDIPSFRLAEPPGFEGFLTIIIWANCCDQAEVPSKCFSSIR